MKSRNPKQEQTSGEGAVNYQAGGDIIVQTDLKHMREIALAVYKENALELRGIAEDIAYARADKLTSEFLERINEENPQAAGALSDPDMQSVLFDAQTQFARSGEDDLGEVLVDLLTDRASQDSRTLRTLALNEAIHSAPKLTEQQRRVIGLVFILRYSRYTAAGNAKMLYDGYLKPSVVALANGLPDKEVDYQHIEYVGAGTLSFGEFGFGQMIRGGYGGLFTNGFDDGEIPTEWDRSQWQMYGIRPALRDPSKFQVNVVSKNEIDGLEVVKNKPEITGELKRLCETGLMSDEDIVKELGSLDATITAFAKQWDDSPAKRLTLTSVGIAIGHAYWRRITSGDAPLSIWLG
ncbi:LPO_1073/Vpar_1526 family protein [Glutamicibacter sp. NPDC090743]|uniref:LPO_1073/Vpar_1526 family protein n=1 Tax=Glutamicibacter sp. NPDC090743 TaxID=3364001 RepID=UPI003810532B